MNDLKIENLQVNYAENCIIKMLNLQVESGELLVVLGPSGCGKSTLLSAISGLVEPSDGVIAFANKDVYSKHEKINIPVEKRNIGFVFQDYAIWPHMNVYNNIAYPLKVKKIPKSQIKERVAEVLKIVNLENKETSYPGELSGGEKQRVALARAIAMNPLMLLLDEPLANLDANLKGQLMREIKRIQKELGITMIYVTHDQNVAFEIADRVVIMKNGRIIQEGTPKDVYMHPKNMFVANFLGDNNIIRAGNTCKHSYCKHFCNKGNQKSAVCIRPEDIKISKKGKYCGKIRSVIFKGCRSDYTVESENAELIISSDRNTKFKVGEEIKFDIKRHHIINESNKNKEISYHK
jgi:ABC-type Fe3+/spermidine/putrescine transport system ATPase subunit